MQEHTEEAIKQPVAEEPVKAQRATKPGRQENVYLAKIGLMIFVTFVFCSSLSCCVTKDFPISGMRL